MLAGIRAHSGPGPPDPANLPHRISNGAGGSRPPLPSQGFGQIASRHWHAPIGDRRTKDRLTEGQRASNHLQAGLRALVEQSIGHLANAWALRRWRGLLYRVRDVFRAAGALVCLGRWLHRIPT
jgi:hypothetical protein